MSAEKSNGERVRLEHALNRIEACVQSMRIALREPTVPIGHDAAHALTQTAIEVAVHAAAADMALRCDVDGFTRDDLVRATLHGIASMTDDDDGDRLAASPNDVVEAGRIVDKMLQGGAR